jgi:putative ABC transport system permease protein
VLAHAVSTVVAGVGEALALAAAGIALGTAGALALTRVLQNQLYAVSPTDPTTFALAGLGLAVVAVLASGVPAFRATRVDPAHVLRG